MVEIAASDAKRIYVSGIASADPLQGLVERSDDGGPLDADQMLPHWRQHARALMADTRADARGLDAQTGLAAASSLAS
jgi:hypothetical protein